TIDSNSNVTPPGHYWVFIVNSNGVPSVGSMISVQRPYQQSTAADGILSIEVERFHDNVAQGGHSWNRTATAGASGTGAQQSLPNNGGQVNTGYSTASPRMDFWVNFTKTGIHHVWARGQAATGSDDSYHFGLDGAEDPNADRIHSFGTTWTWKKTTMDNVDATVNVTSTGLHRVSVWMREDGLILDKLVLTVNAAFVPTGTGPAESAPY
ncbi:MAG TPA: galactose oxidase-like domain-containing protein, partial [Polyangia bacterium]|nr:galactose oxidase-like domain-containing protein [Polyangia bacterium]